MPLSLYDLVAKLEARLKEPLPGLIAHEPLRATPIGQLKPKFDYNVPPRLGAVLILLYEDSGEIKFPLTKRTVYLGAHSGQISLPGGKTEQGEDAIQTALREGHEEIGIEPEKVKVLGTLTNHFVIPSNFMVTPVLAYMETSPSFIPQTLEVARIMECKLEDLLREDAIHTKEIIAAGTFQMMAPHFDLEGEVVWGATAMMLNEFRQIIYSLK